MADRSQPAGELSLIGTAGHEAGAAPGGAGRSGFRRLALSRWGVLFSLTALAGIALRVYTYRSALGTPNSDEAVVGLMVQHALHGDLTMFFWGSPYGGQQEVFLTVPIFWIFGSSWLALRVVPITLSAVAALIVWRVGRRTIGEPGAAVAAGVFWVWPPFVIFQLTQHQSFYASNVVYCGLVVLLALRIVERPDRLRVALFGLVLGLAFWQSPQIVPVAVPAIAWTILKRPRAVRHLWAGALAAVAGALPWIVWNALNSWRSLDVHGGLDTYRKSLRILVSPIAPMTLGLRAPFTAAFFFPSAVLTYAVYVLVIVLFGYGAWRTRHRDASILYFVVAVFPFVYALARMTSYITGWPQYTVIVTPVLAVLFAQLARTFSRAVAVLALAAAISAVGLHRMDSWIVIPQPVARAPRNLAPLITTLDRLRLDRVYADYWIAYLLDFDTNERIIGAESTLDGLTFANGRAVPLPGGVRYVRYNREVAAARHGFVWFRRTPPARAVVAQLVRHGYSPHRVGPFVVYAPGG